MTNKEINAAYIGSEQVDKIYLGEDLVYGGEAPEPIYSAIPLTFEVISAGTLNFRTNTSQAYGKVVRYTMDAGETWTTITTTTGTTNAIQVQPGDKVQFYGLNNSYGTSSSAYNSFFGTGTDASTATVKVYGNIMSLVSDTGFTTATTLNGENTSMFTGMFTGGGDKLVDASHLILPATTLANSCYQYMFSGCTSLTTAPELPATTLAQSCYQYMFRNCTSLTTAPELPATTLVSACYAGMFFGCTSLTTAPELPATSLATNCYADMFNGCTSLTTAPSLPATTLAIACYSSMFYGCTSLTTAPVLPATTLANSCYSSMFHGCTSLTTVPELLATTLTNYCYDSMFNGCRSLNYIKCLATNISAADCLFNWVNRVASTGTFVKAASMTSWPTGASGIPSGWTVQDYVDPNAPVLKIAGQSITASAAGDIYEWYNLLNYSGTSFTIEVGGVPITADTWNYYEYYIDECGEPGDITYETGTTRSVFEANSGYISVAAYFSSNNRVGYESADDNTSDDPQTICECQGGCWDGETCQECAPEDPCDDWEGAGYSSYEDCTCAEHGEGCEEPSDPCDDWEGNGYSSWEECTCAERGENCEEEPEE